MWIRIEEGGHEIGFCLFSVGYWYPKKLIMDNIYIYQQRSQGHFNRVIQPILATAMTAWRGEGEFELVLRNVVNSGLRAHFERAGLQKIPVVDFTQDGLDIPVPREAASYKLIIPLQD